MGLIAHTVFDQRGRPVPAAQVKIYDSNGALVSLGVGNPITANGNGFWSVDLNGGTYELLIYKGADFISREQFVCGAADVQSTRRQFPYASQWTYLLATPSFVRKTPPRVIPSCTIV